MFITAGALSGSGRMTTDGGYRGEYRSGGGGGGRIALNYETNTYSGTISAHGGEGWIFGGAGTIYTKASDAVYGKLIVDNGGNTGAETPEYSELTFADLNISGGGHLHVGNNITLPELTVSSGGQMSVGSNATLTVSNLITLTSGGHLSVGSNATLAVTNLITLTSGKFTLAGPNTTLSGTPTMLVASGTNYFSVHKDIVSWPMFTNVTLSAGSALAHRFNTTEHIWSLLLDVGGDLAIENEASIDVSGAGYAGGTPDVIGNGPGAGGYSGNFGGGGGYGGEGGGTSEGAVGGAVYGNIIEPEDIGSGGGGGNWYGGGAGGGAVRLSIAGTLLVNGAIESNGAQAEQMEISDPNMAKAMKDMLKNFMSEDIDILTDPWKKDLFTTKITKNTKRS